MLKEGDKVPSTILKKTLEAVHATGSGGTSSLSELAPAGKALGDRVVQFVQANAQELGLDHAIWRQSQHNADGSSSGMSDRGDPNQNHFNHVHIASIGGGYSGY